jgi:hypothetical protein
LIAVVVIPVFTLLWNEPFAKGVHWSGETAKRRSLALVLLGLATGFGISLFGSFLPMPKDPPIMQAMLKSPLGAWMLLIFGVTAAPMIEELAFRACGPVDRRAGVDSRDQLWICAYALGAGLAFVGAAGIDRHGQRGAVHCPADDELGGGGSCSARRV